MTKLVDILAKELTSWPEDIAYIVQDPCGTLYVDNEKIKPNFEYWNDDDESGEWFEVWSDDAVSNLKVELAEDYRSAIITKEMWEDARAHLLAEKYMENTEVKEETIIRYNVGDRVMLVNGGWGVSYEDIQKVKDVVYMIESAEEGAYFGEVGYKLSGLDVSSFEHPDLGENGYIGAESFKRVKVASAETDPKTSNESASFSTIFTGISCVRKKEGQGEGFTLYDESATTISLDDDAGGMYIRIEQDCDGQLQYIKLDFDEIKPVFDAIQKLIGQEGVK